MIYGNFLGSEREFSLGMGREWEWKSILPGTGMETGIASREWMGMGIKKPFPQTSIVTRGGRWAAKWLDVLTTSRMISCRTWSSSVQ